MLEQRDYRDGHLTGEAFAELDAGELSVQDRKLLLTHLEDCIGCMDDFLETLTEESLIEPPDGMEDRILAAVREEAGKQKQSRILLLKITKLAVAVCLTMVLFAGGVFQFAGRAAMLRQPDRIEQQAQTAPRQEERSRKNALGQIFSGINDGFIDFAKSFNSFTLLGDGKK